MNMFKVFIEPYLRIKKINKLVPGRQLINGIFLKVHFCIQFLWVQYQNYAYFGMC